MRFNIDSAEKVEPIIAMLAEVFLRKILIEEKCRVIEMVKRD